MKIPAFNEWQIHVAKLIGQPINPSLPVPIELGELADTFVVDPGEKVYRWDAYDTLADEVLDVDTTNANITALKVTPESEVELSFKGLNTKMQYVHVDDVMDSADVNVLGRKKKKLMGALDKLELRTIFHGIVDGVTDTNMGGTHALETSVQSAGEASGDDLYDIIMKAKHKVEDYGDDMILCSGSAVKEKIDTFDKDKSATFNYNVTLTAKLAELGIKVMKIFGTVKWTGATGSRTDDAAVTALLNTNKFVLAARNSRIADGKPVIFVRRRINAQIASYMGCEVDEDVQRALFITHTPLPVGANEKLAYGVYAYEKIILAIVNPYALVKTGSLSAYL